MRNTITVSELVSILHKTARRAVRDRREKVKVAEELQASTHRWHFNTCLDCGVSSNESITDICPNTSSKREVNK